MSWFRSFAISVIDWTPIVSLTHPFLLLACGQVATRDSTGAIQRNYDGTVHVRADSAHREFPLCAVSVSPSSQP